jgi:hypothetical protein
MNPVYVLKFPNEAVVYVYQQSDDLSWIEFNADSKEPSFSKATFQALQPLFQVSE